MSTRAAIGNNVLGCAKPPAPVPTAPVGVPPPAEPATTEVDGTSDEPTVVFTGSEV